MPNTTTVYNFYATCEDLMVLLQDVELRFAVKYVECGLFDDSARPVYPTHSSIPSLGLAQSGDSNFEPTFLVLPLEASLKVRAVAQRRGGTKFAVDQLENPGTVAFKPGGRHGAAAVIAGMVGSVHSDDIATDLLKAFCQALTRHFTIMRSYSVGTNAKSLHDSGARLTKSVGSPPQFDLVA